MCVQKREAPAGEKPEPVRTHLRNMIIVPEMIGSVIGVYNGKTFNQVEIKVLQICLSLYFHFTMKHLDGPFYWGVLRVSYMERCGLQ